MNEPAYTDADVHAALVAVVHTRALSLDDATAVLGAVVPGIVARAKAEALREAANELDRRAALFRMSPSDKVRRQTHADIARWLRSSPLP